jgi:hypothetical protein
MFTKLLAPLVSLFLSSLSANASLAWHMNHRNGPNLMHLLANAQCVKGESRTKDEQTKAIQVLDRD